MGDGRAIGLASDHAGFDLKEDLRGFLQGLRFDCLDLGVHDPGPADYPDLGARLAGLVSRGRLPRGILVCGTGIGMAIVANKFPNVRAALAHDLLSARLAKEHTDANILALGGRLLGADLARAMVAAWIEARFEGGRHERRLEKIRKLEQSITTGLLLPTDTRRHVIRLASPASPEHGEGVRARIEEFVARHPGRFVTAAAVAREIRCSPSYAARVLHQLEGQRLVAQWTPQRWYLLPQEPPTSSAAY